MEHYGVTPPEVVQIILVQAPLFSPVGTDPFTAWGDFELEIPEGLDLSDPSEHYFQIIVQSPSGTMGYAASDLFRIMP